MYNEVWPYGKRTHTGHDFNDLLIEYGPEFVKNSIEQQIARTIVEDNSIELTVKNKPESIPAQVIEDQLNRRNFLHVAKSSVGAGKTHEIIHSAIVRFSDAIDQHVAKILTATGKTYSYVDPDKLDNIEGIILMLVPNHKLSQEFSDRLTRDTGISSEIYKSIEQMDPENPDQKLCKRAAEIAPHRANMIDMQKEICATCPFFEDCGFQNQLRRLEYNRPRVLIASQNMLQSGKTPYALRGRRIVSIIVDESPLAALEKKHILSVAEINEPLHPSVAIKDQRALLKNKPSILETADEFLTALNATIKAYVKDGKPVGAYDFAKRLTHNFYPKLAQSGNVNISINVLEMLEKAHKSIYSMLLGKSDEKDWKNRSFNARVMRMVGFIEELKDIAYLDFTYDLSSNQTSSCKVEQYKIDRLRNGWQPLISFVFDDKTATTHLKMTVSGVHKDLSYAPIIFADATAEMSLIEPMFGRHISSSVVADIAAPHARFFQDVSRSYSKTYLSKKKNIEKIADFISRTTKGMSSVLVVTNKSVAEEMRKIPSLQQCAFEHFNAVAGLDGYKNYEACFVIGRPQPSVESVSDTIHALGGTHDAKEWQQVEKSRTVVIGCKKWTAKYKGAGSSDPIANGVLQQTATGQVIQGLGRLRQIWREEGAVCDTYILSDVSVPFPVEVINPAEVDLFDDHQRMQVRGIVFDMPAAESKVSEGTALAISNRTLEERRAKLRDYGVDQSWRAQYTAFYYRLAGPGMKLQSGLFDSRFTADDVKRIITEHLGEIAEFAHTDFDADTFAKPQPADAFDELNFTPQALIEPEVPAYLKQICGASAPPT
ncbi:hypothetical protein [Brucella thiophenivorans]|nr:hypothetical protein [Brucella thiophenivorans]